MLAGWILDAPLLWSAHLNLRPMVPNTAALFAVLGIGLWCARPGGSLRTRQACAIAVITVAALTGAQDLFGFELGIDQLLARDTIPGLTLAPGRMALATSACLVLTGIALLTLDLRTRIRASDALGVVVAAVGTLALLGHLYGVHDLYALRTFGAVALHTAIGLLLACVALFAARPTEGLTAIVASSTGVGSVLRRFLPAWVLPVALGWLVLRGEQAGLYDSRFGVAILIAGGIGLLAAASLVIAVQQRAVALDRRRERARRAAQAALREREAHYRDLYENSPDLYASVSVETENVLDCNQTLLAALGYEKHEIIGSNVGVLYHGDHGEAKEAARREFFATGEVHDAELALRRKDGSKLDVSLNVTSLRDADGRVVSARAVWRDISARKQADRDRRFLSEFSDLLRSATDPHEAMARVAERLAQHLKVARCLFAEVDVARNAIIVRRDFHHGLPSMKGRHRVSDFSATVIGELRAGRTTINRDTSRDPRTARQFEAFRALGMHALISVPLRLEGELAGLLTVGANDPRDWQDREISLAQIVGERTWVWVEQLRASDALRQSEARKGAILDSSFDAIVSIDHFGAIAEFNPAAERLFGYARSDVLGRPMVELIVPPALRAAHQRGFARYLETGEGPVIGKTVALPALRADGVEIPVEVAITPVAGEPTPLFTASIRDASIRDVGERVGERVEERTRELLRKISEREAQLQDVHHRLGDNLNVISSLIDMQTLQVRDAAGRRALGQCHGRVVAIALIHEHLHRAKDQSRVPFSDYARNLAGDLAKAFPDARARASIEFALEEVALPLALAIPCGLVLNELIANALEHAFTGRPSGRVHVALSWQGGGRLRLAVSDDGIGLPHGFDVERCDSLGMQLVTALARQLQARISVEPGGGAYFAMTLPVAG